MRLLGATLALLCLLGVAGVVVVRHRDRTARVDEAWEALTARAGTLREELSDDPAAAHVLGDAPGPKLRPVLRGEAREGRAFEHYLRAAELLEQHEGAGDSCPRLHQVLEASEAEREAFQREARTLAPLLRELALGARSRDASYVLEADLEWEFGLKAESLHWLAARRLARIAHQAALVELAWGDPELALGHLLDVLQLARDLGSTSLLNDSAAGVELLAPPWLRQFVEDGGARLFDADQRARWIDALEEVDEALPTLDRALQVELTLTVEGLERYLEQVAAGAVDAPLSSLALKEDCATYYDLHLDFAEAYLHAFRTEPLRRPHGVLRRFERLVADADFYLSNPLSEYRAATTRRLWELARLRLLRVALGAREGREGLPETGRLGLPILEEPRGDLRRYYLDVGRQPFGVSLEVLLPAD